MIHVLIIVPYPELLDRVSKILDTPKYQEAIDATIQLMTVDKVDQVVSSGYDLIIAGDILQSPFRRNKIFPFFPFQLPHWIFCMPSWTAGTPSPRCHIRSDALDAAASSKA